VSKRLDPTFVEDIFRPVYEMNISGAWGIGAAATPFTGLLSVGTTSFGISSIVAGIMAANSVYWGFKGYPRLKKHYRLHVNKMTFITEQELRDLHELPYRVGYQHRSAPVFPQLYLGEGFEWGNEHSNRAYQVMDFDSAKSDVGLPFPLNVMNKKALRQTRELGGQPWIHAIGDPKDILVDQEALFGHSIIFGNVGTGKTTMLKLLSMGLLHLGNVLLILDPKDDDSWEYAVRREMEYLGMGDRFYKVQPSSPSKSARFPLLKRYTRVTEIADRVAPLMGGEGSSKGFQDFAHSIIYSACLGMEYIGRPINLVNIQQALVSQGRPELARAVFDAYYENHLGENWLDKIEDELEEYGAYRLEQLANYYYAKMKPEFDRCEAVEKIWELAGHEDGHYQKMVVTLKPVLNALTAAPMDEIFSPQDNWRNTVGEEDSNPIIDLDDIMQHGGCIYIALESLADTTTAGYLSRIITAEASAAAGRRYSERSDSNVQDRRVSVINDEVQASIENNDAMLNLAAMGRQAQFQLILATQTRSDLLSKMSNQGTADRFLGLTNNFISMRSTDPATQEYAAKQFNKTSVTSLQAQSGKGTDAGTGLGHFSSNSGVRAMKQREDAWPESLLGDLPKLQYIAKLADGRKLKGKLPIYLNDGPQEVAPWVKEGVS